MKVATFISNHIDGNDESNWKDLTNSLINVDKRTNYLICINDRAKELH